MTISNYSRFHLTLGVGYYHLMVFNNQKGPTYDRPLTIIKLMTKWDWQLAKINID